MGDVTRLPKWAQRDIEDLTRQVQDLQKLVDETRKQHGESNVRMTRFRPALPGNARGDADWHLPRNAHIEFSMAPDDPESPYAKWGRLIEAHIDHGRDALYVSSSSGRLSIEPSSGNSVFLKVIR